jgi:transposase
MNDRLYPISEEAFNEHILPIIKKHTSGSGGRPPVISHYTFFCAVLKMLSVSLPWRDCPIQYGPWHTIYTRFQRWSENGLFWEILRGLREQKHIQMDVVFMDSTTIKVHRHGMGASKKKAHKISEKTSQEMAPKST